MATDVLVNLDDRPGELARLGEAAGAGGVNIQGLAAFTGDGKGVVHVLVDDDDLTRLRRALDAAGTGIADEREVLVVDVVDRPGTWVSSRADSLRPMSTSTSPTRPSVAFGWSSPPTTSAAPDPGR